MAANTTSKPLIKVIVMYASFLRLLGLKSSTSTAYFRGDPFFMTNVLSLKYFDVKAHVITGVINRAEKRMVTPKLTIEYTESSTEIVIISSNNASINST